MPKDKGPKFHHRRMSFTINMMTVTEFYEKTDAGETNLLYKFPDFDALRFKGLRYMIAGLEISPETEMMHYQGYAEFYQQMRIRGIKAMFKNQQMHIEPSFADGNDNIDYCSKDGEFIEMGHKAEQGFRSDLLHVADLIREGADALEIFEQSPSNFIRYPRGIERAIELRKLKKQTAHRQIYNILNWGVSGAGKTHAAMAFDPDLFVVALVTKSFLMIYPNSF